MATQAHDIIVIGASAGGLEQFSILLQSLPADLPASIFIVQHIGMTERSYLPTILERITSLPVSHAHDQEPFQKGHIYICPPNHHMVLEDGIIRLNKGPRENGHRPAIDPLFRSASRTYGSRVIGVILSGNLFDGTEGLFLIKRRGGIAIVQDPNDALYPSMPRTVLTYVDVDYCLPTTEIGALLKKLAYEPVTSEGVAMKKNEQDKEESFNFNPVCPECGGAMEERHEGSQLFFKCHTGHKYSLETFYEEQSETVERALWTAYRLLKEKAMALEKMGAEESSHRSEYVKDEYAQISKHIKILEEIMQRIPIPNGSSQQRLTN